MHTHRRAITRMDVRLLSRCVTTPETEKCDNKPIYGLPGAAYSMRYDDRIYKTGRGGPGITEETTHNRAWVASFVRLYGSPTKFKCRQ